MAFVIADDIIDLTEDDGVVVVPAPQASKPSGLARSKIASPPRQHPSRGVAIVSVSPSSGSSASSGAMGGAAASSAAAGAASSAAGGVPTGKFARLEWEMSVPTATAAAKAKAKEALVKEALSLLECSVCFESYNADDGEAAPHSLRCGHLFHKRCVQDLHQAALATAAKSKRPPQDATCPICFEPFTPDTAHRVFF